MALPALALVAVGTAAIAAGKVGTKSTPEQSAQPDNRRTRSDYTSTSFTPKVVDATNTPINPVQPTTPFLPYQGITGYTGYKLPTPVAPLTPSTEYKQQAIRTTTNPIYNYYSDPYQVNSLLDVFTNRKARDLVLKESGWKGLDLIPDDIPFLGKLDDLVLTPVNYAIDSLVIGTDYLKRSYVEPIAKLDFAQAGTNALLGSIEVLDTLSNPIKGLVLDGPQGFIRGLGIGSEGRTNYDYDIKTGNGVLDFTGNMLAEIFSDPLNLISLGGKSVVSKSLSGIGERVAKESGAELSEHVTKSFGKSIARNATEDLTNSFGILRRAGVSDDLIQQISRRTLEEVNEANAKRLLKSARLLTDTAESIDRGLLMATPIGWTMKGAGLIVGSQAKSLLNWIHNRTLNKVEKYYVTLADGSRVAPLNLLKNEDLINKVNYYDTKAVPTYVARDMNLPNHNDLVRLFRENNLYTKNSTEEDFLNVLVNKGLITVDNKEKLLQDKSFLKYYTDSVAEEGTQMETVYKTIADSNTVLDASINQSMTKARTKLDQVVILSRELEQVTGASGDLKTQYETLVREVERAKQAVGQSANSVNLINLELHTTYLNTFEDYMRRYNIDVNSLADVTNVDILTEALGQENPKAYLENALKQTEDMKELLFRNFQNSTEGRSINGEQILDDINETIDAMKRSTLYGEYIRDIPDFINKGVLNGLAYKDYFAQIRTLDQYISAYQNALDLLKNNTEIMPTKIKTSSKAIRRLQNKLVDRSADAQVLGSRIDDTLLNRLKSEDLTFTAEYETMTRQVQEDLNTLRNNMQQEFGILDPELLDVMGDTDLARTFELQRDLEELFLLKEITPRSSYKDVEYAVEMLEKYENFLGDNARAYSTATLHDNILTAFENLTNEKVYSAKFNQLYADMQILNVYNTNSEFRGIINDLASDENTTTIGALFNLLNSTEFEGMNLLTLNFSDIKQFKKKAKTQINFESFLTAVSKLDDTRNTNIALLDLVAGANPSGRKAFDRFYNLYYNAEGIFNLEKFKSDLDYKINGRVTSGAAKNSNLWEYLHNYTRELDVNKLHDASYDGQITWDNLLKLSERGYTTMDTAKTYTVFDLETTGLEYTGKEQITQIAANKYAYVNGSWENVDSIDIPIRLQDGTVLSQELQELYGEELTNRILASQIQQEDAVLMFKEFIADDVLVGHNSNQFDIPFFKDVTGLDLPNQSIDTLELAKKMLNYQEVSDEVVNNLRVPFERYLKKQKQVGASLPVELIDANTINKMYDFGRDYMSIAGNRMLQTSDVITKAQGSRIEYALQRLLGKEKLTPTDKAEVVLRHQQLLDAISELPVNDEESMIQSIRNVLSEIKAFNREQRARYITSSDIGRMSLTLGSDIKATNPFAFFNAMELNGKLDNKYVFSNVSVRSVNPNLYKNTQQQFFTRFNERIRNNVARRTELQDSLIDAMSIIEDPTADVVAKLDAIDAIAAHGSNTDQAARLYGFMKMYNTGGKASDRISDYANNVIARTTAQYSTIAEQAQPYLKALDNISTQTYNFINNGRAINETLSVLSMAPKELAAFITDKGLMLSITDMHNPAYAEAIVNLLNNKDTLEAFGYVIKSEGDTLYVLPIAGAEDVLRQVSSEVNGNYGITYANFNEQELMSEANVVLKEADALTKRIRDLEPNLSFNSNNRAVNNITANMFYEYKDKLSSNLLENTLLADPDYMSAYFKMPEQRRSYHILGSVEGRRGVNDFYKPGLSSDLTVVEDTLMRLDGKTKYMESIFNNDLTINGSLYKNLSDEELLDIYNQDTSNYTFLVLTTNKDDVPIVKSYKPITVSDMKQLRELDAVLAPQYFANSIIKTINIDTVSDFKHLIPRIWYKYIVSSYKSLYLSTIGMITRNVNDMLIKNNVGGQITDVPYNTISFFKALKDWRSYESDIAEIYQRYTRLTREAISDYYNSGSGRLTLEGFDEIHEYATSSISAGMATAQQDAIKQFYTKEETSAFDKLFFENTVRKNTVDRIMDINSYAEHAGRLSNLRIGLAQGLGQMDAYNRVLRTHFDYGMRTKARMYAETIIPFVTFPLYNLQYWTEAALQSPWLIELLLDMSKSSLNIEDQKQFTLDNSNRLQAALLNGNISIGGTLFKMNQSVFDAFQLVTDSGVPDILLKGKLSGQLNQRLVAPVKKGLEQLNKKDVNEFVTKTDEVTQLLNDLGLYNITRTARNITKGVNTLKQSIGLDINIDDEVINGPEDIVPSLFQDSSQNYGARIGEDWTYGRLTGSSGTSYTTTQTGTGITTKLKYYPKNNFSYNTYPSIKPTAGRSYNRIPYTKRYYSPRSYNAYNRYKGQATARQFTGQTPSPESMRYAFKNLLYNIGYNSKALRYYNVKQRQVYSNRT